MTCTRDAFKKQGFKSAGGIIMEPLMAIEVNCN